MAWVPVFAAIKALTKQETERLRDVRIAELHRFKAPEDNGQAVHSEETAREEEPPTPDNDVTSLDPFEDE